MDKELAFVLCMFSVLITMIIGFRNVSAMDVQTYKLTLTTEGCGYIQSLGLPVDREAVNCSVKLRFCPNRIGASGTILLDDDRHIAVSESMLLATEQWGVKLPPTAGMKASEKWAWFWFCLTTLFGTTAFMMGRESGKPRRKQR